MPPRTAAAETKRKARWQSGYAADCKSVDLGSTPGGASTISKNRPSAGFLLSGIVKLF